MWAWLAGKTTTETEETHQAPITHAHAPAPRAAAPAAVAAPAVAASARVPPTPTTTATVATSGAPRDSGIVSVAAGAPPEDGSFWGFTSGEVSADRDDALNDMMTYFGFSHREVGSDYVGCVSFELSYPDGRVAKRTVQVLPRRPEAAKVTVEEMSADDDAPVPTARVTRHLNQTPAPSTTIPAHRTSGGICSWLPAPACTLFVPPRVAANSSSSSAASAGPPLPTMPFSSRVRIFDGPLPSDVKPTARLLCPRAIFFDVYLGRLDPMTSVLTGQAHCPGWRYMELMHFGQSFEMHPDKWKEFYAQQAVIEEEKQRRGAANGTLAALLKPQVKPPNLASVIPSSLLRLPSTWLSMRAARLGSASSAPAPPAQTRWPARFPFGPR